MISKDLFDDFSEKTELMDKVKSIKLIFHTSLHIFDVRHSKIFTFLF